MALEAPAGVLQDASSEILVLHTAIALMGTVVTVILLRALLVLRRTEETLPGLLTMIWIMLAIDSFRAVWLVLHWISQPTPVVWDLLTFLCGFIVIVGIPVMVSAKYLPKDGAYMVAPRPWVWMHRGMVVFAVAGLGGMIWASVLRTRVGLFVVPSAVYVATALLLLGRISFYRNLQVRRRPLMLFAVCTISGLLLMAAYSTYSVWSGVRVRQSMILTTLNVTSLMLILCGIIFVFANVRFADVIVKRALRIVLWTCASVTVWLAIARSYTLLAKPAGRGLICLLIAGAAIVLMPVAERRLNRWIDTWVFEQLDFQTAIPVVWRELIELESQDAVFRAAETFLQRSLRLASVRILPAEGEMRSGDLSPPGPGPYSVATTSGLVQESSRRGDIVVPLFLEGQADHSMVLSLGVVRPPLTALEMGFVERVAGQMQIRLGMLLAESHRADQVRREALFREELFDAELRALRAQVNPHFLFNSLNTIADLTVIAPEQAEEMTLRLSAVFRYILVNTDKQFISLKEELDFAHSYLHIEQTRFGDRLKTNFAVDPATLEQKIPTLLLQPLIENALKHGLSPKREGGALTIRSEFVADCVSISVLDDGVGLRHRRAEPGVRSANVGVENVSNRLRTAYGSRASFVLRPRTTGGTEAVILIPRDQDV